MGYSISKCAAQAVIAGNCGIGQFCEDHRDCQSGHCGIWDWAIGRKVCLAGNDDFPAVEVVRAEVVKAEVVQVEAKI